MRSGHEAVSKDPDFVFVPRDSREAIDEPDEVDEPDEPDFVFVRKDSKRQRKMKKLEDPVDPFIPEDCTATKFAGWMDNGTKVGLCGFTFLLPKPKKECSNYYAQAPGQPGEFYQCHFRRGDCVVWAGQYSSKKACSSVKPEIQALLKAREDCHNVLCDYARSGKWNGNGRKSREVGVRTAWPEQTTDWGTWGWAKTAQKKCDPNPLLSAVFKHQVDIWQNNMTYKEKSQVFFDKRSCGHGCTKDSC